ncbi:coiled-coil domain-containing protein [Microlunatus flavus]|uniref:Uncharacterized protein n=1 Tax=Microlunatus flavus TaxID=1036181 RepID=A0A1H9NG22_9ACTN|nr:hypothetical protein [Microlunatus flavus]SER34717.1 hypothetical protein SAMN05421756_11430 [Microlunatus flavus]
MSEVEDAARELYALAPEEFVAARTRLVKQARAAKDRALANEIGALRKPTRTAWLVNAVARDDPDAVAALLDLGEQLRTAQQAKDGKALRDLSARRRKAIDALVRRAGALGEQAGHPPTEATVNELAQTLQAALGDAEVAEQVRAGTLAGAAVYGGFGGPSEATDAPADGGGDLAALLAASMPGAAKAEQADDATDDAEERSRREAAQRRAALEAAREEARQALDDAQQAADAATEEADRAAEEVDRLRGELQRAEDAEREARTAARTARDEVRARRAAADEAEQALRDAEG